jgi:hypothetical protein
MGRHLPIFKARYLRSGGRTDTIRVSSAPDHGVRVFEVDQRAGLRPPNNSEELLVATT